MLPSNGELEAGHNVTSTATTPATLGKLMVTANCTFTADGHVTIKELYLYEETATVTFGPAAGVRITVQKIVADNDGSVSR